MNSELQTKLEALAYKKSIPFCYGCYTEAHGGICKTCHSDDLMRLLPGVGCEWGTEWIIKHILETELTPVNTDETFVQHVRDCYPETVQVGWMTLDTVQIMKDQDPISWQIAQSEYESQEADDGNIVSFDQGGTYFWLHDIETLIE